MFLYCNLSTPFQVEENHFPIHSQTNISTSILVYYGTLGSRTYQLSKRHFPWSYLTSNTSWEMCRYYCYYYFSFSWDEFGKFGKSLWPVCVYFQPISYLADFTNVHQTCFSNQKVFILSSIFDQRHGISFSRIFMMIDNSLFIHNDTLKVWFNGFSNRKFN